MDNQDAPWILRLNPLFTLLGFKVWWKYEYLGGRLVKSEIYIRRNR